MLDACVLLSFRGNIILLSCPIPATEGGEYMDILISLLVSIMGGVACHYIVKWLDRDDHDN